MLCVGFTNEPHSLICRKATRLVLPKRATRHWLLSTGAHVMCRARLARDRWPVTYTPYFPELLLPLHVITTKSARGARQCPHRRGHPHTVHGPPPGTVKAAGRCLRFRRGKSIGGVWHRWESRPRARGVPAAHERCIHRIVVEEVVDLMHGRGRVGKREGRDEGEDGRGSGRGGWGGVRMKVTHLLHERIGISVRELWGQSGVVPGVEWVWSQCQG